MNYINYNSIQSGDIIAFKGTNIVSSAVQSSIIKGGHKYSDITHVGIVCDVTEDAISILQSTRSGVGVKKISKDEFLNNNKFRDIQVLRNDNLSGKLSEVSKKISSLYLNEDEKVKTDYSYKHLATVLLGSPKRSSTSRKRTIQSYQNKQLMTSSGKIKKAVICSELVAEVIKISQIEKCLDETDQIDKDHLTKQDLKAMQRENKVLSLDSEVTSPSLLIKKLVDLYDFQWIQ